MKLTKCHFCTSDKVELTEKVLISLADETTENVKHTLELGYHTIQTYYAVKCNNCGAYGPQSDDKNEAIETWNQLLFEVLLINIWNDHEFNVIDEDKELMILSRKVNHSYVSIWFDVETQQYIVYLLWYSNDRLLNNSVRYRNIVSNYQSAVALFHDIYIKMMVNYDHSQIAEKCSLNLVEK